MICFLCYPFMWIVACCFYIFWCFVYFIVPFSVFSVSTCVLYSATKPFSKLIFSCLIQLLRFLWWNHPKRKNFINSDETHNSLIPNDHNNVICAKKQNSTSLQSLQNRKLVPIKVSPRNQDHQPQLLNLFSCITRKQFMKECNNVK